MSYRLFTVDNGKFNGGIKIQNGRVIQTAPCYKYMMNWPEDWVRDFIRHHHWGLTETLITGPVH